MYFFTIRTLILEANKPKLTEISEKCKDLSCEDKTSFHAANKLACPKLHKQQTAAEKKIENHLQKANVTSKR